MPILPPEDDVFPADYWQKEGADRDPGRRWWCLHTKPRQEKAAARHLRALHLTHYLPSIVRKTKTPGGRALRSVVPLFPGYLFLLADDYERAAAVRGNHLANVLHVLDQAGLVRDLRSLYHVLASGQPVVPEPSYPVGTRVRILDGPLQGAVGTVTSRLGRRERFAATIQFLGRGASIELMDWQVEPLEPAGHAGGPPHLARVAMAPGGPGH
jgi:transcription antitermination factor NusG